VADLPRRPPDVVGEATGDVAYTCGACNKEFQTIEAIRAHAVDHDGAVAIFGPKPGSRFEGERPLAFYLKLDAAAPRTVADNVKPPNPWELLNIHPAPWTWHRNWGTPGWFLVDARGLTVIGATSNVGLAWVDAVPEVRALTASAPNLSADLEEAVRLLRGMEWCGRNGKPEGTCIRIYVACPECKATRVDGHTPGCRLAAFLAPFPKKEGGGG
jgi:hypothetical protein